jgi:hypothetical protein
MYVHLKSGTLDIKSNREFSDLSGFASRNNSKRGFLFLSKVIGKHYPSDPSQMQAVHKLLAQQIKPNLNHGPTVIFGFSETATCLGYGVYLELGLADSYYHHSTRHQVERPILFTFNENHSHASTHYVYYPDDTRHQEILKNAANIVLVDDEYTTGNTLLNIISSFKKASISPLFIASSILDWTENSNQELLPKRVSLVKGKFSFSAKKVNQISTFISEVKENILHRELCNSYGRLGCEKIELDFKKKLEILPKLNERVLVLGTGEFMNVAFELARFLQPIASEVLLQSTTRSPILLGNDVKSVLSFKDNYGEKIDNFLYNVADKSYDHIYVCYETNNLPDSHNLNEQLRKIAPIVTTLFF